MPSEQLAVAHLPGWYSAGSSQSSADRQALRSKREFGPPSCRRRLEEARTAREAPLLRGDALRPEPRGTFVSERSVLLQGETERAGQLGGGGAPSGGR